MKTNRTSDKLRDFPFRMMAATFKVFDLFRGDLDRRVETFGIQEGMTVVDYGCGPGRYTVHFARRVGPTGKVYAVDIHELAAEYVMKRAAKMKLDNIETVTAKGYDSGLPNKVGDMICALDMFFMISEPTAFLAELHRIIKPDGVLIIDDGHQSRAKTKKKLAMSSLWDIQEEMKDHLKCHPIFLPEGDG